ncbi:hypothetical protein C3B59_04105 [Cryobacterium zongtaii]|uniref:DUF2809 domain-containing protein n=1 Tax=Cryobacterium zongtaii TaxID=1259217 RepID=A0A2S3ZP56_9MICO|nr:DUF2809 domain-containing protein [Cryobacterium zongtaii]POH70857.1 hypothetical protein C3B59_04105 [Cryobacterium zongtaii]
MDRTHHMSHGGDLQPEFLDDEHPRAMGDFEAAQGARNLGFRNRRLKLAAIGGLIMATGLVVHFLTEGIVGDFVGDALYAVLVYLVVSIVAVRRPSRQVAIVAILICVAVELLQLTGVPSSLAELFAPMRYLLGTTFNSLDLVAYVIGVLAATAVSTWRKPD